MDLDSLLSAFKIPLYWSITLIFSTLLLMKNVCKKNKYYLRIFLSIVLLMIVQTGICFLTRIGSTNINNQFASTSFALLFFIFEVILLNLLIYFCYDISIKEAIFFAVASYSLEHLSNSIKEILLYILNVNGVAFNNYVTTICFNLLFKIIVMFLVYFLLLRKYLTKYQINDIIDNKILVISIINLCICMVLSLFKSFTLEGNTNKFTTNVICNIYAIFGCFLCLYLQFAFFVESKLLDDNKTLDVLIKEQNKNNELFKENIDLINIKFHDLKKELRRIEENNNYYDPNVIDNMKKTLSIYDFFVKTGNSALDSIIMNCNLSALKNNIDFTYLVDGNSLDFMKTEDVVSLFDNLLDNALEATLLEEEKNRLIYFEIHKEKQMLRIHIHNYSHIEPKLYNGIPMTLKNKKYHGYGMKSILMIVKKYNGDVEFLWKENIFTVNIIFSSFK